MPKLKKGGLGKGLDALFAENNTTQGLVSTLRLTEIEPNKEQPRKEFDEEALADLSDSIKEHGLLQPILVRPTAHGSYQIIAGERRWRAARLAGLTEVPAIIREAEEAEVMEMALIENLQRENLNIAEEALGYRVLMEKYDLTQEEVAKRLSKSRPAIANAIRILNLPAEVLAMVRDGELTAGHARALLALEDEQLIVETARKTKENHLSVRFLENFAKQQKSKKKKEKEQKKPDHFYQEMEIALANSLARKVKIVEGKKKGVLEIEFYSKEDLVYLSKLLAKEEQ